MSCTLLGRFHQTSPRDPDTSRLRTCLFPLDQPSRSSSNPCTHTTPPTALPTATQTVGTRQAGTDEYEVCYAVAVRPTDGGALLAGYSQGTWDGTANSYAQAAGVLLETGAEEAASTASMAPTPSLTSTSTAYSEGDVPLTTPSPLPAARTTDEPSSSFPTTTTEERTVSTTSTDDDGLYPPSSSSSSGTCGADESFRIVSSALPGIQGCFQITSESFAKGSDGEYYTRDGILDYEKLWVFGYDNESQVRARAMSSERPVEDARREPRLKRRTTADDRGYVL